MTRIERPVPTVRLALVATIALVALYEGGTAALLPVLDARVAVGLAGPAFLLLPLAGLVAGGRFSAGRTLGIAFVPPAAALLAGLAGVIAVPAVLFATARFATLPPAVEEFFVELLRADSPRELGTVLVVAALIPAVCEELLFRGWLQRALARRIGGPFAVVLAAVAFGLIHGVERGPTAAGFGLMLGWLALRSGSVAPAIAAHAAVNTAAVLIANADLGAVVGDTGAMSTPEEIPAAVALASAGLTLAVLLLFHRVCPPAPAAGDDGSATPLSPVKPDPPRPQDSTG